MPKIIKNEQIIDDQWTVFKLGEQETAVTVSLPDGPALLPLAVWLARKNELLASGAPIGVWLDSGEEAEALVGDLKNLAVVAVNFPKFTDGRSYSTARLLRERYGYQGEIRAIGDVLHDQLFYMKRCGINAFALLEGKDIDAALAGLRIFSDSYQGAVDQPSPLFRRRAA